MMKIKVVVRPAPVAPRGLQYKLGTKASIHRKRRETAVVMDGRTGAVAREEDEGIAKQRTRGDGEESKVEAVEVTRRDVGDDGRSDQMRGCSLGGEGKWVTCTAWRCRCVLYSEAGAADHRYMYMWVGCVVHMNGVSSTSNSRIVVCSAIFVRWAAVGAAGKRAPENHAHSTGN